MSVYGVSVCGTDGWFFFSLDFPMAQQAFLTKSESHQN